MKRSILFLSMALATQTICAWSQQRIPNAVLWMRNALLAVALCALAAPFAIGQATTVFAGRPAVGIREGGIERRAEDLPRERAANLECVISKIGENYYWASRENTLLVRMDPGGAFVTFVAANGSGYIRIVKPDMKQVASLAGETEAKFDYVEHLLVGLNSVTYYGNTK